LDFLPSANLKFDLANNLILHFSAAQTLARPDYSALGAAISLTDLNNTGSGGNPNLKPIRSTNYDTTLEWYYAPQSLLQFSLFDMEMSSYVDYGTSQETFFNIQKNTFALYNITLPINTTAQVRGAELAWTQPLGLGFGAQANFTYANGHTGLDTPMVGQSAITYNVGAYYEAYGFSAHLDYTYRSHYLVGLDHSSLENEDGIGNLGAALNYTISRNLSLSLNMLNLANETLKYYAADTSQPRAFYTNGRQFYFGVRAKL
jgi:iron complex outermembrane receptor protein